MNKTTWMIQFSKYKILAILFMIFLNSVCCAQSEYAVTLEKEVKVREEPNINSTVKGIIKEEEIFWIDEGDEQQEWVVVSFFQDLEEDEAFGEIDKILDNRMLRKGFVHESKIRRLEEPDGDYMVNEDAGSDNYIVSDSILVYMSIVGFKNEGNDPVTNQERWGVDENIPENQIAKMYIKVNGSPVVFRNKDLRGFYEPNFRSIELNYDKLMGDFIISMKNSDGARAYQCIWQVSLDGTIKRYAFRS